MSHLFPPLATSSSSRRSRRDLADWSPAWSGAKVWSDHGGFPIESGISSMMRKKNALEKCWKSLKVAWPQHVSWNFFWYVQEVWTRSRSDFFPFILRHIYMWLSWILGRPNLSNQEPDGIFWKWWKGLNYLHFRNFMVWNGIYCNSFLVFVLNFRGVVIITIFISFWSSWIWFLDNQYD